MDTCLRRYDIGTNDLIGRFKSTEFPLSQERQHKEFSMRSSVVRNQPRQIPYSGKTILSQNWKILAWKTEIGNQVEYIEEIR